MGSSKTIKRQLVYNIFTKHTVATPDWLYKLITGKKYILILTPKQPDPNSCSITISVGSISYLPKKI
jgi:hypothetical protein